MITWFQSLDLMGQVFAIFAVPATLVLILQTILLLVGLGSHGDSDADADSDTSGIGDAHTDGGFDAGGDGFDMGDVAADGGVDAAHVPHDLHGHHGAHGHGHHGHDSGFRLFTVRGFITFFTLFGWTGLVCIQSGLHNAVCLFVAAVAGLAGMVVTALVMRAVLKLQIDGTANLANALGKTATVYIRVPAKRSERGKVNLVMQEKLMELSAVTDEDVDLPAGSEVVVVGLSSSDTLIVAVKGARVVRDKVKM